MRKRDLLMKESGFDYLVEGTYVKNDLMLRFANKEIRLIKRGENSCILSRFDSITALEEYLKKAKEDTNG